MSEYKLPETTVNWLNIAIMLGSGFVTNILLIIIIFQLSFSNDYFNGMYRYIRGIEGHLV